MGTAANAGGADVEHHCHTDALSEGLVERKQAPVDGELTEAGADLSFVFKQNQGENRAAEADSGAAGFFSEDLGATGHPGSQYGIGRPLGADYERRKWALEG